MRYLLAMSAGPRPPGGGASAGGPPQHDEPLAGPLCGRGLEALLATSLPAGKPVSLAPAVLASLEQALQRPEASPRMRRCANGDGGRTAWRSKTKPCTRSCGRVLRPSAKSRAPVTHKKPEAIPAFQATCQAQLQRAIPSTNTRPVRGFSPDESRFGLLTIRRRRLTACGVQPVGQSSTSSHGSLSMAPWNPPRASAAFWNCRLQCGHVPALHRYLRPSLC